MSSAFKSLPVVHRLRAVYGKNAKRSSNDHYSMVPSAKYVYHVRESLEDLRVEHEPLGDSWYFGPERVAPRFSPEQCAKKYPQHQDTTYDKVWDRLVNPVHRTKNQPRVFIKDMSQYIFPLSKQASSAPRLPSEADGNPTFISTAELLDPNIVHTFLIRTPEKAIPSYYRLCTGDKCAVTGFEYFDPEEIGLRESRKLYEFIRSKTASGRSPPLVVDSEDLVTNPEGVMKAYCDRVGVDFTPEMLNWSSGNVDHFKKWAGWHDDITKSTGIIKQKTKEKKSEQENMPQSVLDAIESNMADYHFLREQRLVLTI